MRSNLKRRQRGRLIAWLCKLYGIVTIIIGVLIVIGTVGASDQMMVDGLEALQNILFGLWLAVHGYFSTRTGEYVEAITW